MDKLGNSSLLSYLRYFFYEILSERFEVGSLKWFMDIFYVVFEKIAFSFEFLSTPYILLYDELVDKELSMIKKSDNYNILVVGCGSIPATTILISQKIQASITCIDIDKKAVYRATQFLKTKNLSHDIKVYTADGIDYPVDPIDVIILQYGIRHQKEMLISLSKQMNETSKVIFRTTYDALNKIVGGELYLRTLFQIANMVTSEKMPQTISLLLTKKTL